MRAPSYHGWSCSLSHGEGAGFYRPHDEQTVACDNAFCIEVKAESWGVEMRAILGKEGLRGGQGPAWPGDGGWGRMRRGGGSGERLAVAEEML